MSRGDNYSSRKCPSMVYILLKFPCKQVSYCIFVSHVRRESPVSKYGESCFMGWNMYCMFILVKIVWKVLNREKAQVFQTHWIKFKLKMCKVLVLKRKMYLRCIGSRFTNMGFRDPTFPDFWTILEVT